MDTYIRQKGMGFVHVDPSWPGKDLAVFQVEPQSFRAPTPCMFGACTKLLSRE